MTIMWTQASFNQFLLSAQMKYLEGNIFVNFYIFGVAGILAVLFGGVIYAKLGLRQSYMISFLACIFGCIGMFVIQTKIIGFPDEADRDKFDEKCMPVLILILKMGIINSFITTTQVSFTDDRIFPAEKRNTSVGTCGMIARSVTIVAPIVNEWAAPWPIVILFCFALLGYFTSFTFPMEGEFADGEKIKEIKYDITAKQSQGEQSDLSHHSLNNSDQHLDQKHEIKESRSEDNA